MTFGPLMVPLLAAMPFGPLLAWKRGDVLGAAQRLTFALVLAAVGIAIAFAVSSRGPWLAPFGIALGLWVMGGAVSDLMLRTKAGQVAGGEAWRRFKGLPRSAMGGMLSHFGVGLMVIGVVATSAYRSEGILVMKPGESASIGGYDLTFRGVTPARGANYTEQAGVFEATRGGSAVTRLEPAKRLYDAPPQPTTEAGIHASWRGDLYVVLGDPQPEGGFAVRLYFHPLVRFIWLGALVMFFGGAVSLSDRRLRIGAPVRARSRAQPLPAE